MKLGRLTHVGVATPSLVVMLNLFQHPFSHGRCGLWDRP